MSFKRIKHDIQKAEREIQRGLSQLEDEGEKFGVDILSFSPPVPEKPPSTLESLENWAENTGESLGNGVRDIFAVSPAGALYYHFFPDSNSSTGNPGEDELLHLNDKLTTKFSSIKNLEDDVGRKVSDLKDDLPFGNWWDDLESAMKIILILVVAFFAYLFYEAWKHKSEIKQYTIQTGSFIARNAERAAPLVLL